MREPENSYEISFVIMNRKPKVDLELKKDKLTEDKLIKLLGFERINELREWMKTDFTFRWFTEHV